MKDLPVVPEPRSHRRMMELVESFPTLQAVLEVWDPARLDRWACGPEPGSGALHAARFVLSVWTDREWDCGRFDFHAAWGMWDDEHRGAFLAWAREPWYP